MINLFHHAWNNSSMPSAYSVSFARANGEPLFSSHMLDLSEEFDEENIATCVKYFKVTCFGHVLKINNNCAIDHDLIKYCL